MSDPITRLNAALGGLYRIERELGEGGMATVYLADDLKHGRQVALKVLKPELAAAVGAERFLAEIKTTAGLQHPHILPLFDSGEADGLLYYVMPYVRGESLAERLERTGPLSVDEALSVLEDVSSALAHAHATGIVHRDVKPANVLLSDGGAFVADFGIALALSGVDRAQLTATGLSLGTPNYMSPEQIGGDEAMDGRSDVYALGCLLFEALVGTPPFEAATLQGLMGKVMTEPPPALRGRRSDVPVEISDAVAKALAKRPGDRFATAQDFYTACSATSGPAARGPLPRLLLVGAGVVVLAAGIAGWRTVQTSNARGLLPEIERLAEAGSYVQAYDLAEDAELWLAEDSTLDALMTEVSDLLTITSEPPGAGVFLQRVPREVAEAQDSQLIGTTPLTEYRVPRASHRVVIRLEGGAPVERIASSELRREFELAPAARHLRIQAALPSPEVVPPDMVAVPGGPYELSSPDAPTGLVVELEPFFIDRYEVTNRAFAQWVGSGGYGTDGYWTDAAADVRERLVDATGLPGPRGWSRQTFPRGQDAYPVSGVSWFEASAYCRSMGRRLPTAFEWDKTARDGEVSSYGTLMPWGRQMESARVVPANFNSDGPQPVDAEPFGVSPYGAYAMAGNVREWLANPMGEGYAITGGSWSGPSYLYTEYGAEVGTFASESLGFRCAVSQRGEQGAARIDLDTRTPIYTPVSESDFETLLGHYAYDRRPANPRTEPIEEFPSWTRERVWIDGVSSDSVLVYFYAPRNASPPFQTIVYLGSSATFSTETVPQELEWVIGPTIQAGRAALGVVLKGMVERPFEAGFEVPPPPTVGFRDLMVLHATELRLGMDYAVSRSDVDASRLAYTAFSFGAGSRLVFSAVDDRYKAVVYLGGGIDERVKPTLPEADNVNFAPYVRAPKLVLNGRSDEEHGWLTRGLPLWNLLREPKELVLVEGGGHLVPISDRIPAINDFLDRQLGPVRPR